MDERLRRLARKAREGDAVDKDHYIAALEQVVYGEAQRSDETNYPWQLDIWGEYGAHWGRGYTPEEALYNAYRLYARNWDPEEPFHAPEGASWRYRPIGVAPDAIHGVPYYHVVPPEIDLDAVLVDYCDKVSTGLRSIKTIMAIFGAVDIDVLESAASMGEAFDEWYFDVEGREALPGPAFCQHENAEDMPQNGPNLAFCHTCHIMFRTDLP